VTVGPAPATPRLLEDEDFVWRHVWPLLSGGGKGRRRGSPFTLTMHRIRGDERRAVAEYGFEGPIRVVAKLYRDSSEGRAAYDVLCGLWRRGFGPGSLFRVPEPIAYLFGHGVLLMGAAPGEPLRALPARGRDEFQEGLRNAARWLAALHASPVGPGSGVSVAQSAARLSRRAASAAARRPDLEDVFRTAIQELARRCALAAEPKVQVQTHGRYHAEHVFLAPDCVTVIDLDRAALADPMKDVGEFLHRLRWQGAREGWAGEALEESTEAFLAEYSRHSPVHLSRLTYYWSYSILWTLLGSARKGRLGERKHEERSRFLQAQFALVPQRASAFRVSGPRTRPIPRRSHGRLIPRP
jgi:hypothetical protein